MSDSKRLTPAQKRAVAALLIERDVRAAAIRANVGESTLHRWLSLDNFQAALREAETAAIDSAVRRLAELTGDAVETLRTEMGNTSAPPAVRIRAADVVLSRLTDMRRLHSLEERLAALEKAIGESNEKPD